MSWLLCRRGSNHSTALLCIMGTSIVLHWIALHRVAMHCVEPCCMVWYCYGTGKCSMVIHFAML